MEKKQKLIILLITLSLVLVCTGLSFAFFTSISNNESASTIYAKGGRMSIKYANGSGNIVMENIYPREEAWVNKEFTVTGNNSTELDMEYRIYLKTSSNGFNAGDLTYSISGTSTNSGDKLVEKANQPLAKTGELLLGKGIFKSKTATHSYNLRIFYKEKNVDQNNGQGKSFTGYVRIDNGSSLAYDTLVTQTGSSSDLPAFNGPITRSEVKTITLTSSSKVPANAIASWDAGEKQDGTIMAYLLNKDENGLYDLYIGQDGKVVLGKNAAGLFSRYNQTSSLDLTNLDTSKVTDMSQMFSYNKATSIKGLENFDTSKVTDMSYMFQYSQATTLNLSSFDTSNVTDMSWMFRNSQATTLDLSSFDTSKVTDMSYMFQYSQATTLNLSSFDTSNVTDMSDMFLNSQATTLNLSSFDTSKVTDMSRMFSYNKATSIKGLDNFDTSNVTDMSYMFRDSQATTLDLSSFDTSNVTDMSSMFYGSHAATGYARTQADADKLNSSSNKPARLTFTVKS